MGKNNSKEAKSGDKAAPAKGAAKSTTAPAKTAQKASPDAKPAKKDEPKKAEAESKQEEPKAEPKVEESGEQKEEKAEEQIEDEELVALYKKLQESKEAKSLLKKYLTKDIFATLKDKKTKLGCDLKSCIRSGCENLDSGIGVYASDAEAYVLFADLFNQVICDYHKLDTLDGFKHPSQNFAFDTSFPGNVDESGEFVLSTRIRVARNVSGYPLRGGMDEKQTVELEQKVKAILEGLEDDDLKGKYFPLEGMSEEDRAQLVADHFLFKKGDRFLESAGINDYWPKGRGIFFNDNKTFLVWINEEDQLRIISMEQGGNVQSVFNRLEKAVAALCEKLEFAYNEQLGYLTACPTNIGCGERASVHIKLPLLSEKYSEIEAIAAKFNLQIRGIHGEHSESKGGVYDVSNKRRLGITEWDGVKDLVQGTQALIEAEKALQPKAEEAQPEEEAKEEEKPAEAEAEAEAEPEAAAVEREAEAPAEQEAEPAAEAEKAEAAEEAAEEPAAEEPAAEEPAAEEPAAEPEAEAQPEAEPEQAEVAAEPEAEQAEEQPQAEEAAEPEAVVEAAEEPPAEQEAEAEAEAEQEAPAEEEPLQQEEAAAEPEAEQEPAAEQEAEPEADADAEVEQAAEAEAEADAGADAEQADEPAAEPAAEQEEQQEAVAEPEAQNEEQNEEQNKEAAVEE